MAVPKPINLPSRRAENNGFDPNVQLVPGGSWAAPAGKAAQPSQASTNGPPQKAEAAESPPTASASKAAWSVQQLAPPRLAASSNASADFPKLGVAPPIVTAGPSRFQPAAPQRSQPTQSWREEPSNSWRDEPQSWRDDSHHSWRDEPPQQSWREEAHHNWRDETPHNWRDDSKPVPRSDEPQDRPRYTGAYQPPSFRGAGQSNSFYGGPRNRADSGSGSQSHGSYGYGASGGSSNSGNYGYGGVSSIQRHTSGGPSFGSRAWAEDDEGEMDFRQPIVIPPMGPSGVTTTKHISHSILDNGSSGGHKPGVLETGGRAAVRLLDPVEEARLLAKKKQLELERMEQQLLEQQRRAELEAQERERREDERRRQEAQKKAAEEAQARAAEEARIAEERRRRQEQERLEEQRRMEERRREEELRREEEARALKREEERLFYRNQPQLMKQSIETARQRRQQEEERMAAERKIAAEQKLRALDDRCAQRERELREREEREAHERAEREARERAERLSRERREQERRQQQQEAAAAAAALEQQQRRDQHRSAVLDSRDGSRSPPTSPGGEWGGMRRGGAGPSEGDGSGRARPFLNGPSDAFRREDWERAAEPRNSWPASRRDGPGEALDRRASGGLSTGGQRDRNGDMGDRGPRKLFDPKQNRFVTEDEEPGFLRREMAQREEAERQKREAGGYHGPYASNSAGRESREVSGRPSEQRPRHEDRRTISAKDPAERARLKAEALLERRRREQDRKDVERRELAAAANSAGKDDQHGNGAREGFHTRARVPPPPSRQPPRELNRGIGSDSISGEEPADRPRSAPRPRSLGHSAAGDQHTPHQSSQGGGSTVPRRSKEDSGRREVAAGSGASSQRAAQNSNGHFQAGIDVSSQQPLKDLDLTFGGELLISNSTIGAGVGGLRFGQGVGSGRDPWAMDPSSESAAKDSWDSWNAAQAAAALKPPAWGTASDLSAPPPASLNQIMLEERLAEQRHAAAAVQAAAAAAVSRQSSKSGARPAPARSGARGGSSAVHGRSGTATVSRGTNERAGNGDRDAEADPNKVASEVATGTADFILGGEDESSGAGSALERGFSTEGGAIASTSASASKAPLPYDGAARWEKAVGAVGTWGPWDMHKVGYAAGFGGSAGDGNTFAAGRLPGQPPLSLGFLPLQQPMWSTDGLSAANSLWGLQPPAGTASGPGNPRPPAAGQPPLTSAAATTKAGVSGQPSASGGQSGSRGRDAPRPQTQQQQQPQQQSQRNQGSRQQSGKAGGSAGAVSATDAVRKNPAKKVSGNVRNSDSSDLRSHAVSGRRPDSGAARRPDSAPVAIELTSSGSGRDAGSVAVPSRPARGGHRGGPPRSVPSEGSPSAGGLTVRPQLQQQNQQRPGSAKAEEGVAGRVRREPADAAGRGGRASRGRGPTAVVARGSTEGSSSVGTVQGRAQQ